MKKCWECNGLMKEFEKKDPNGISYNYYKCLKCGEEVLDMSQLHNVAEKYKAMKRYQTKVSKWGLSLGIRIPKELAKEYNLKDKEKVMLIPEKECLKIVPI